MNNTTATTIPDQPDRTYPCCMCPATSSDFQENVCDGSATFLGRVVSSSCGFLKTFEDDRGWRFFVRGGLGESNYKAFYKKPGIKREKGCGMVEWRKSFMQAQIDLNELGKKKGWREVQRVG